MNYCILNVTLLVSLVIYTYYEVIIVTCNKYMLN